MMPELQYLYPEITLALGAMVTLMLGVFIKKDSIAMIASSRISALVLLAVLVLLFKSFAPTVLLDGLYRIDSFGAIVKSIVIFSAIAVLVISYDYLETKSNKLGFEYPILLVLSALGMLIMISANDLLPLYLGLELQSFSLYIIAASKRHERSSTEAAIKYFVLGALASGILLYGVSLIYGYAGSTNFTLIADSLAGTEQLSKGVIVGLVLVLIGIAFKISAAPFHMWTPDVYEGVPTPVTAYFAIVPKLAAFTLFIRLLVTGPFAQFADQWNQVIISICVLSMFVGALGGIFQSNIKRLLAYSSIGHMGYALLGIASNSEFGIQAIVTYFIIYMLTSIGIFTILLSIKTRKNAEEKLIENIDDFKGLSTRHPIIALMLALLMFSMIGLPFPPFAGFFGKFFVFTAAIKSELYYLAVAGMVASLISAYYYLRIVKIMYFDKADDKTRIIYNSSAVNVVILAIVALLSLYIFINPSSLMDSAAQATSSLF